MNVLYLKRIFLALNQILGHLWQTLNAYKTSKLRLFGALRRLYRAFYVLYQNLVLIAFNSLNSIYCISF
jgi:hypothetical protein